MATGHQSPQSSLPPFSQKQVNTTTWGSTANSTTITDSYIKANSAVKWWFNTSTPPTGSFSEVVSDGQIIIYATDAQTSTLAINYIVL